MAKIRFIALQALPSNTIANAVYFIKPPDSLNVGAYVTDENGNPYPVSVSSTIIQNAIQEYLDNHIEDIEGPKGDPGDSAYQVWLGAGNTGTVLDYLNSLKGEPGTQGPPGNPGSPGANGKSAYELAVENGYVGTVGQWLNETARHNGNAVGAPYVLGTTDAQPLHLIAEGTVRAKVLPSGVFYMNAFLGVGTENPISPVQIVGSDISLTMGEASGSTGKMLLAGYNVASNYGFLQAIHQGTAFRSFILNPSGGNVGVGVIDPEVFYSKKLVVQADGGVDDGITIYNPSVTGANMLAFADGKTSNSRYAGFVAYSHLTNVLSLGANAASRAFLFSDGNFSLGNSSNAGFKLDVQGTGRFTGRLDVASLGVFVSRVEASGFLSGTETWGVNSISGIELNKSFNSFNRGVFVRSTIGAGGTGGASRQFTSAYIIAANSAHTDIINYDVSNPTVNSGGTITTFTGFNVDNSTASGITNVYAFRGQQLLGTGKWNLYMDGTADNYLAGKLGVGGSPISGRILEIAGNSLSQAASYGIMVEPIFQLGASGGILISTNAQSVSGLNQTLGLTHYQANQGNYQGTTVYQTGFLARENMLSGSSVYGFRGRIAAGSGRWNLYMDGGASNYLYGKLLIGSNVDSGTEALQVTGGAVVSGTLKVTNIVTSNNHNDSILMHSGTEIKKTRYLKNTYRAMVGESLNDTGMTGLYDRDELVIADKKYNVTVNITGGGTFNPAHLSRIFGTPDVSAFADISGLTANSVMTIDVEIGGAGLPNYSKDSWHPFIQTRLSIASGGAYTYFKKITVYVSENGTDWFTSNTPSAWRCDNFDTQQTIPGYWIGSENSYSGATYRPKWVRFVFEECIPGTTYGYWLQRIGFRHTNAPYAQQLLHKGEGGIVYGSTKFTKGVIVDYTPSSATDSSLPVGSITADNAYLYRRATTGEWKKIAWTTF